ncbi:MAG: type II toxin-antitoxin system RelE/ParE family toxin [Elusimicrobia bacterium]|nr:type II toxin-antitoxin system RelE/ParE family toxin [Elusimicrobiota bacterium]MDE2510472.1 type II toxin-antitoxin system RelE/ParE family toxin [Elusimicrobiota bacterium]
MKLQWTSKGHDDLVLLHAFLAKSDPAAAARAARALVAAPERLLSQPRIGEALDGFEPREVRRLIVGRYELRYEIRSKIIIVIRIWHTRENR